MAWSQAESATDALDAELDAIEASLEEEALEAEALADEDDFDDWEGEGEEEEDDEIEELVVTGRKTDGMAIDATISATAFDQETLANFGVEDVSDIAKITPNLQINTLSGTTPTFFVRGVGLNDFASNATGAVAIYQDGVPLNAPALQLGQIFDAESVQVKRGPQTWGNERNASAGVIDIRSRKPDGETGASFRFGVGTFVARDLEGAVAFPLMESRELSTRIAFRYSAREPFVDNRCGGLSEPTQDFCGANDDDITAAVPAGLPNEVNGRNRWAVRGLFRYQPEHLDMDWLLNVHGGKIDQDSPLGQVIGTGGGNRMQTRAGYVDPAIEEIWDAYVQQFRDEGLRGPAAREAAQEAALTDVTNDIGLTDPFEGAYDLVGGERMGSYGGSVTGDLGFGDLRLTTVTGVETYDRTRVTDYDFSPDATLNLDASDRAWQVTQSLELESSVEDALIDWRTGAFFLFESIDQYTEFLFNAAPTPREEFPRINQQYAQKNYSLGVYGNGDWEFAEAFTLSGGLRLNYDRKDFILDVFRGAGLGPRVPGEAAADFFSPTGGVSLTYRPTDSTAVYVKYSHGWKPGVFNSAILTGVADGEQVVEPIVEETDPESIDSFELGFNGTWLDNTLEMRAALFYYKYKDYQVFLFKNRFGSPPQFEVVNANDAQIYGVEADLYARPLVGRVPEALEGLSLDARFSWLESEFLDFTDTRTIQIAGNTVSQVVDYTGNRLPNTPRFKVSGGVWWEFDLLGVGRLTPRYDVSYQHDVFFDPSEGVGRPIGVNPSLPQYGVGQRAYTLHDLRLTYAHGDGWLELSGWVHNVADERYKTFVVYADSVASVLNWVGDPRTFGVSVKVDYSL